MAYECNINVTPQGLTFLGASYIEGKINSDQTFIGLVARYTEKRIIKN